MQRRITLAHAAPPPFSPHTVMGMDIAIVAETMIDHLIAGLVAPVEIIAQERWRAASN